MPKVPKPRRTGPTKSDINRFCRVPQVRDRALRAVGQSAKPPAVHDNLRQLFVLLYHCLFLSPRTEAEIALEFFRCSRHLIEGGDVDTIPITLISREVFKKRYAETLKTGSILHNE